MLVCVVGSEGKMGQALVGTLKTTKDRVMCVDKVLSSDEIGSREIPNCLKAPSLKSLKVLPNVVIDVGGSKSSVESAKFCALNHLPLLIMSAGQSKIDRARIKVCAQKCPILMAPNTSRGVGLILKMLSASDLSGFDAAIVETHHQNKKDNPSGTAIMLEKKLKARGANVVSVSGLRLGEVAGTHTITLCCGNERITITHTAAERKNFADGAITMLETVLKLPNGLFEEGEINEKN